MNRFTIYGMITIVPAIIVGILSIFRIIPDMGIVLTRLLMIFLIAIGYHICGLIEFVLYPPPAAGGR